jgi:hypothetical protein
MAGGWQCKLELPMMTVRLPEPPAGTRWNFDVDLYLPTKRKNQKGKQKGTNKLWPAPT